jgi:hypothetical protein
MDHRLDAALADARAELDRRPLRDLRAGVRARINERAAARARNSSPLRRAFALGVAAAVLIVGSVGAGLALRYVTIERTEDPGVPIGSDWPVGRGWQKGTLVDLADARAKLSSPLVLPTSLGEPDATYLRKVDGVLLVTVTYDPRPGYPAGGGTGPGVMLVHLSGALYNVDLTKEVPKGAAYQTVKLDGIPAIWVAERFHLFDIVSSDGFRLRQSVAADTLIWELDDAVYRLESRAGLEGAQQLAVEMVQAYRALQPNT